MADNLFISNFDMKKYVLLTLLFVFSFLVFDFFICFFSEKIVKKQTTGSSGIINKTIHDSSSVLILGSSRAANHYNSEIIQNNLGISVFNGGMGGQGIFYSYAILNERLKKHTPQLVILDLASNIMIDKKQYDKLTVLYPLLDKYDSFYDVVKISPSYSPVLTHLNAYRYNSTAFQLIYDVCKAPRFNDSYVPIEGEISNVEILKFKNNTNHISNEENKILFKQLEYVNRINLLCRHNGVKFIVFISPSFCEDKSLIVVKHKMLNYLNKNNIMIHDFSSDKKYYGKNELFKDIYHLNSLGSKIYSKDVSLLLSGSKNIFFSNK